MIGLVIGTKLTGRTIEKSVLRIIDKSPTLKKVTNLVEAIDKIIENEKAVQEITGFFKAGRELMQSPEARNFFANVTELLRNLSGESEVKLKLPERK
jgi:hypothetical protein